MNFIISYVLPVCVVILVIDATAICFAVLREMLLGRDRKKGGRHYER